ncbi:hypothetical protein HPB47_012231 [Ixodes persulcatus]|uniref:Uncharacterized protein n=1 Tax=Ixodes persulcatus TaxID=34615 RepID=A0AC60NU65_IXOPE|nr:hypothetical protein HPB47_012231 [Ixodes persulcatus]
MGVIHGIPDEDSEQDVLNNLVTARNPNVRHARRMGRSKSAVVLFKGQKVPFWIMYGNVEYKCKLYKKKIEVCDGHACSPSCGICGKAHPTGDTRCKQRFKTPVHPATAAVGEEEETRRAGSRKWTSRRYPKDGRGRGRGHGAEHPCGQPRGSGPARGGDRGLGGGPAPDSESAGPGDRPQGLEKKSKEAKTQNDKLDEILVMMRQLQEENKALRVM